MRAGIDGAAAYILLTATLVLDYARRERVAMESVLTVPFIKTCSKFDDVLTLFTC